MRQPNKTEKLTDKAFSRLMFMSILWIIVTLALLCSTTWAWFKTDISSQNNSLRTATTNAVITVQLGNGTVVSSSGANAEGRPVYTFEKDVLYTITLTTGDFDTANAYCTVLVNGVPYHSEQIFAHSAEQSLSFTLQFSETETEVEILPRWGILNDDRSFFDDGFYRDLTATTRPAVETTKAPETTKSPTETTAAPTETTAVTTETTAPAETTTAVPSETIAPTETTAPVETTAAPSETIAPIETTAPAETTAAPSEPIAPAETTAVPDETTVAPTETTAVPAETTAPAETPVETAEETLEN